MHRSIESLCCIPGNNSIAGELFFKSKFIEEITFVVTRGRRRYEIDTEGFHCGENCQKCWKQEKATSQILKIKQSSKVYKPEKGV